VTFRPTLQTIAPLVLLPGLDGTGLLFRRLLGALPDELRAKVLAYPTAAPMDLSQLAALVLRQLPAERVVLLAESFSGLVALELLTGAAARIRGVIFVGAFAEPPRPLLLRFAPLASHAGGLMRSIPAFFLRRYCLGPQATAAELNALREAIAAITPGVLAQRLALIAKRHSFGTLAGDVPVFYMKASADKLVPASCASWFQRQFKRCELAEVRGPHFLLQANPRDSAAVITRAVRALS
jgi:pimeloyl-[acyl-carrier protein] methyl ester esterase